MKTFLVLIIAFFSIGSLRAQETTTKKEKRDQYYNQGIVYFENKEYRKAAESFIEAKYYSKKDEDIYFYLAASSYYSNAPLEIVYKYISKGIFKGDKRLMLFYCIDFPHPRAYINDEIYNEARLAKKDRGFYTFCMANIMAKQNDEEAFLYLESCLQGKYEIPLNYQNSNPIRTLNEKRYIDVLNKYKLDAYKGEIEKYAEQRINEWQGKGKYEKTEDYKARVTKLNREFKIKEFVQDYIDSVGTSQYDFTSVVNNYDADNEVYKLIFKNNKSVFLSVPITEAPEFDANFNQLKYENATFTLTNNQFDLLHVEVVDNANNKTYVFDSEEVLAFNTNQLNLKFNDIEMDDISTNLFVNKPNISQKNEISDVDINIPENTQQNPNKYALIIGNEDYTSYQTNLTKEQNVEFAKRDATIFKEYCIKTLGIPAENIIFRTNAGVVQMHQSINQMQSIIKNMKGDAEIIFYYAGHGFPDEKTNTPYIIPVDVSSSSLDMALQLDVLIEKFTTYPSKSLVILLDACFTGGGREMGLLASRGVSIVPNETKLLGNVIMLSASNKQQSALAYNDKQHGLFTYFLLKKLQETKGEVTLMELDNYLQKQVPIKSTLIHSREQNPKTYFSPQMTDKWGITTL